MTKPARTHRLSVLIASADPSYGSALATALTVQDNIEIKGEAAGVDAMLEQLDLDPDLVIVVFPMGEASDWEAIAKTSARTNVLVLGPEEEAIMIPALEAGAQGYLVSEASFEEIGQAIRSVSAGTPLIPPSMLGSLLRHVVRIRREERKAQERLGILTSRELEIFRLVARGLDKHGIGQALFISPQTARTHIQNILTKLGLHSQMELVALASQCGIEVGGWDG